MPRVRNQRQFEIDQQRALEAALSLLAENGARGATLRSIASHCGISLSKLVALFPTKDALLASCFESVVARDIERLTRLLDEVESSGATKEVLPKFLWAWCGESGGNRRADSQALLEVFLTAMSNPEHSELCKTWLLAYRDSLRELGSRIKVPANAMDVLGFQLLAERSFMISCAGSATYQIVAEAGLNLACDRYLGLNRLPFDAGMSDVVSRFLIDVVAQQNIQTPLTRGEETKQRIIDAAAAIVESDGLSAVTNRAVAEQAGVSLALTTYHFDSVSDLAFAGMLALFERINSGSRVSDNPIHISDEIGGLLNRSKQPKGVGRLVDDISEISLAASRGRATEEMALALRQQVGSVTFSRFNASGIKQTRLAAACYSLWAQGLLLADAVVPVSDHYDCDALFLLVESSLLQVP